jgi:hypothetical protein
MDGENARTRAAVCAFILPDMSVPVAVAREPYVFFSVTADLTRTSYGLMIGIRADPDREKGRVAGPVLGRP